MTFSLALHPASPWSLESLKTVVQIRWEDDHLALCYSLDGPLLDLCLPRPSVVQERRDELWQNTCFELFLRQKAIPAPYLEFNFSPDGNWAFYRFSGYRHEMQRPETTSKPEVSLQSSPDRLTFSVRIPTDMIAPHFNANQSHDAGLAIILEKNTGEHSYWAALHPSDKPDFHHPESFLPF